MGGGRQSQSALIKPVGMSTERCADCLKKTAQYHWWVLRTTEHVYVHKTSEDSGDMPTIGIFHNPACGQIAIDSQKWNKGIIHSDSNISVLAGAQAASLRFHFTQ